MELFFYIRCSHLICGGPLKPIARVRCNMQIDHFRNLVISFYALYAHCSQPIMFSSTHFNFVCEINAFIEHQIDNFLLFIQHSVKLHAFIINQQRWHNQCMCVSDLATNYEVFLLRAFWTFHLKNDLNNRFPIKNSVESCTQSERS